MLANLVESDRHDQADETERRSGPAMGPDAPAPLPMVDAYLSMMRAAALVSAGELGLFEALARGPVDLPALAGRLRASEDGLGGLVDYLVSIAYLERRGTCVSNSAHTQAWFTSAGTVDYTPGLLWTGEAWELMRSLTAAVRDGGPRTVLWDRMSAKPGMSGAFSAYMHAFALHLGDDLLDAVPLADRPSRLLDLGGSHGIHAIALCERCPDLHAVIADLAPAFTYTEELIARQGMTRRIRLLPGDLNHSDWGSDYDVILFLSVAHNLTAAQNRRNLARMFDALRPGGAVVIHDYMAEDRRVYHEAFRLTLLVETGTRIYAFDEYRDWLEAAGFERIVRVDLDPREKGSLIVARRPDRTDPA